MKLITSKGLATVLPTLDIIAEPIKWSAARYEQEYDHNLTIALINEEVNEFAEALVNGSIIGQMDGAADIFFVAIGALWKTGLSEDEIREVLDDVEWRYVPPPMSISIWLATIAAEDLNGIRFVLTVAALSAFKALEQIGFSSDYAVYIISAICRSNNTKAIVKTNSNVKANIAKGDDYVSPEAELNQILKELSGAYI